MTNGVKGEWSGHVIHFKLVRPQLYIWKGWSKIGQILYRC